MRRRDKIFEEYPDVVSVEQMCVMLGGIGKRTAYAGPKLHLDRW